MKYSFIYILLFIFLYTPLWGEEKIVIKTVASPNSHHEYYVKLLQEAFLLIGQEIEFELYDDIPQLRVAYMLDTNQLSLCWQLQSEERSKRWVPVEVGLTGGLIGQRVFFIGKGQQHKFDSIQTLNDFRESGLTGVLGATWFDTKIWDQNNLPYLSVVGNWRKIYTMIASGERGIDYFSRGVIEILPEAKNYPMVDIEKNLLLIYDRDFIFYMSEDFAARHGHKVKQALQKARDEGLIKRLVEEFWADDLERLQYHSRTRIYLDSPK